MPNEVDLNDPRYLPEHNRVSPTEEALNILSKLIGKLEENLNIPERPQTQDKPVITKVDALLHILNNCGARLEECVKEVEKL